jgi:protoporphyrinogen oxidase
MPTEEFISQTLRPLLEAAYSSSQDSDSSSVQLQQQIELDRLQKIADDKQRQTEQQQRQKEQQDSATAYSLLSSRAATLQSYLDGLSSKLTDFSGSEAEKQAAALAAVDSIISKATALERERDLWRLGTIGAAILAVILGIVAAAK